MFIRTKYSGYNRHGEQCAAGSFLILMEPKHDTDRFPQWSDVCSDCGQGKDSHTLPLPAEIQATRDTLHRAWAGLFMQRVDASKAGLDIDVETLKDAAEIILDAIKRVEGCRYFRPSAIGYPIKAIVRHTSLSQCGHFMMGSARIHGHRIVLSGSYGGDGLTCSVPDDVYANYGVELPDELRQAWAKGGGWNSAGSEAPKMREWALQNLAELRR